MFLKCHFLYALAALVLNILAHQTHAAVARDDNSISNLYENLLQREYAGPVVFPNHQVERKAQRSPSLRLRFGRRSDPDMLPLSASKRWFGDVNQKPIRSPSLRLRFGRRSDPSIPLHSSFDALMNDLGLENNVDNTVQDYNEEAYGEDGGFERAVRKPQRLRWGRSVPYEGGANQFNDVEQNAEREREQQRQRSDDFLNSWMNKEKLRNILINYENDNTESEDDVDAIAAAADEDGFQREVRKPAPLRLRWGRSTGGRSTAVVAGATAAEAQKKKSAAKKVVNMEKSDTQQQAAGKV